MCPCQAEINGKMNSALWAGRKSGLILTQVPSHQIGIVEILHAQSNDVDEFLYDLHELHRPGIDLDRIKKMRRHFRFHKPRSGLYHSMDGSVGHKIKVGKEK